MKAIEIRGSDGLNSLKLTDLPDTLPPGRGEIVVRLRASSLNYHDYAVVTGMIPVPAGRIPMSDGAGEVIAVGEGVTDLKVGDAVVSTFFLFWDDGREPTRTNITVPGDSADGYAREVVVAAAAAFTLAPRGYTAAEAATLTCAGLTAWRALVPHGPLMAGETVLVQGTGGVSIFALQFAKMMGAKVIATSSSDEKLERLGKLGADHLINYRTEPKWGRVARDLSDGGVDHVVEIGGSGTMPQSIEATRFGGHIALIGVLAGIEGPISTATLMRKQIRLQGLTVGSRRQQIDMIKAIDANGLKPVIDTSFPLEGLADAFRHQESGRHFGKICVDI